MTIGERIQALRHSRGLSQIQFAEEIGVSRQTVSKWESDAAVPDTEKVVALSRLFGVSTDDLLGLTQSDPAPVPEMTDAEADPLPEEEPTQPAPVPASDKPKKSRKIPVLVGVLVGALALLTVGCVLLLTGDGSFGASVRKVLHLTPKAEDLAPAYVLIHGLGGWGEDAATAAHAHYWGGGNNDLVSALKADGYTVVAPSVGPVSSTWDRACELYAKLTGTTVDYGEAHAKAHNHARFGRVYTEPMLPGWGESVTANLIGHSFGGETARLLASLLANGDETERATEQEGRSPLFDGGHTHWVHSVTTLCSPHNGSSLTEVLDRVGGLVGIESTMDLLANIIFSMAGAENPATGTYDFMLDQFGITDATGNYRDVFAAFTASAGSGQDYAGYELTPDGAKALNDKIPTVPEVYYYAYAYCGTVTGADGNEEPSPDMLSVLRLPAYFMGKVTSVTGGGIVIDSTWFQNDGLVNVVSALFPSNEDHRDLTAEEEADPATKYEPGIWNVFPVRRGHHGTVIGMGQDLTATKAFFEALFERTRTGQ